MLRGVRLGNSTIGIGFALIVLLLLSQFVVTQHFFGHASLSVLTPLVGAMIIVTIGQALVIGTGGIDLSVSAVITLVGQVVLKESLGQSSHLLYSLVVSLVICVAIGLVNGLLIEGLGLNALVVTLAVGQLVEGATTIYRGQIAHFTNVPPNLATFAGGSFLGVSYLLYIAIGLAIVLAVFVHRIVPGRRLVLSSAAKRTATLAGIHAKTYRISSYVIAACLYGLGGILLSGQLQTPDLSLGSPYLLATVAAAVLGGAALTGGRVSMFSTLLGAAFLTILDYDLEVKGYSIGIQTIAQGVVLIVALALAFRAGRWSHIGKRWREAIGRSADAKSPPAETVAVDAPS